MTDGVLQGRHVLVVEDEFMLAEDMSQQLVDAGAVVIGPAQSLERAFELMAMPDVLDAAVLDVNLHGKSVYAVADMLLERHVPLVFTTGYDASTLPERFRSTSCYSKPVDMPQLMLTLQTTIEAVLRA
ncbi:response regulator [Rhizobium phaseoli]|uniref:response regulator n=1 Tax=Rhizobium phaseoli TaxID=396 RepID=UPI00019072A2|nr:response regulator [Rhizobium phaseoli]EGE58905.1 response regulator receiver protein [Rhizobium etli CNPAF512]MDH6645569.1 CheY-like chemotaxis protein [Rhizobium esperanzae]PCD65686.1 response regulator [Rhizobium phaseoli]